MKVLIVEDDAEAAAYLSRGLAEAGHTADVAADGLEAVEALSTRQYDLMLLDLSMPRMSGEEVVRWVREHPEKGQGLAIVVVSAWAGDHRPTLNELGVAAVLPKPFRRQHLVDVISQTRGLA